jgi:hypothetical protein
VDELYLFLEGHSLQSIYMQLRAFGITDLETLALLDDTDKEAQELPLVPRKRILK